MIEIKTPDHLLGSKLVSNLGPKLYNDARYAVRELVQNAYDSINDLENEQYTGEFPADVEINRMVDIRIEPKTRQLHIMDNGTGMNEKEIWKFCALGMNEKKPGLHTGLFGIGTYAGAAIGSELEVKTKRYNGKQYRASINFNVIFENDLKYGTSEYISNAEDLISKAVHVYECDQEYKDEYHFTHVKIILRDSPNKLFVNPTLAPSDKKKRADDKDEEAYFEGLYSFLCMYCPVSFSPDMDKTYVNQIQSEMSLVKAIQNPIKLQLNKIEVYKINPSEYIDGLKTYTIKSKTSKEPVAQIWFGLHKKLEAIKDPLVRGLVLYKDGFAVDTIQRKLVSSVFFKTKDIGYYYTGEIHILCNDVAPNMERTEIASTKAWDDVSQAIEEFIKPIEKTVRDRSDYTNAVKKIEACITDGQALLKESLTEENYVDQITKLCVWRDKSKTVLKSKTLKQLTEKEYKLQAIVKRIGDSLQKPQTGDNEIKSEISNSKISNKIISPFILKSAKVSSSVTTTKSELVTDVKNEANTEKESKKKQTFTDAEENSLQPNIITYDTEYSNNEFMENNNADFNEIVLTVSDLKVYLTDLINKAREEHMITPDELVNGLLKKILEGK